MRDRLPGLLLFLPVPVVLWLFTRRPLGLVPSLVLGLVLMATHRLYARPFSLAGSLARCLWCGARAAGGPEVEVHEPLGRTRWRVCAEAHLPPLARTLGFAGRHALLLRVGILGSLLIFLGAAFAGAAGLAGRFTAADATAALRLGVAASVLPLGWAEALGGSEERGPFAVPFPVHIQALVGTRTVVWLFRLIGLLWLVQGVIHVAGRLRGASL